MKARACESGHPVPRVDDRWCVRRPEQPQTGLSHPEFPKPLRSRMYLFHDGDLEKVSQAPGHTNKTIAGGFV
jgi:hypothetical protein